MSALYISSFFSIEMYNIRYFLVSFRTLGECIFVKHENQENSTVLNKKKHLPLPLCVLGFDSTKLKPLISLIYRNLELFENKS